jgi:hypothetical protein
MVFNFDGQDNFGRDGRDIHEPAFPACGTTVTFRHDNKREFAIWSMAGRNTVFEFESNPNCGCDAW